ncbi:hypothetical protein B9Q08_05815 [Candidatus Marsarchaeota G2 archaeon ECH_B_SAG-M15]|jgi:DNA-binding HxlR family transcriptional regulator|uniref:HTH hxlR-type domain-containing protein n=1 Tax=Candidatus Marsarchaeota G2 archaeon ECH_B_SAG-M15 TaxID=1978162 RepID=A0A2R6AU99_9ARCH|nr:MAG: hypothetical protein B9Q08_05815 [Candidatus Marsarchaeota G2 archaeon ECH_B_SAG-M15]
MGNSSNDEVCLCALDGVMDFIGRKWVLFTLNAVGRRGVARFKDLYNELRGISPSTLAGVLRTLEAQGILKRASYPEIPPRVEYSLTKKGEDLRRAVIPLLVWASAQDNQRKRKCASSLYVQVA